MKYVPAAVETQESGLLPEAITVPFDVPIRTVIKHPTVVLDEI